ncbi:hypothetical protein [Capnocytophaga canis]|uniref:hypothetical protein n=1 Tax=Capnocytophaga canis TaxID=1848903 RepID=UPI001561E588|nr:hypothetical protein [Capnocytophaga canis]
MSFKFHAIVKGWTNYLFPDKETERKAISRAEICAKCPHSKKGTYQRLMPDYTLKDVQGMLCELCGCPLSTLLRQDEKQCEKWDN